VGSVALLLASAAHSSSTKLAAKAFMRRLHRKG